MNAIGKIPEFKWKILSRGAGSQFIMSIPHGAINFAVTETTKIELAKLVHNSTLSQVLTHSCLLTHAYSLTHSLTVVQNIPHRVLNPLLDFLSSALSTFICSVVSTPQMVLTDRIMGGVYPNFFVALQQIALTEGNSLISPCIPSRYFTHATTQVLKGFTKDGCRQ